MRRIINITVGFLFCGFVAYFLFTIGELGHLDLSYGELDTRGKVELWTWRGFSILASLVIFAWVVRKNTTIKIK